MRVSHFLAVLSLVALPTVALAGKARETDDLPTIVMTGIAEFDGVFGKAKGIQDKLTTEKASLKKAREDVNTALEVATDSPLETALAELVKKADHKIGVALEGRMPKLNAKDAVPDNVQKGIDAVNGLVVAADGTITTATGLKTDAVGLADEARAFPGKLPSLVKNPLEVASKGKVLGDDVKATGALPDRLQLVIDEATKILADVQAAFGA
jgi:hypothetical protein